MSVSSAAASPSAVSTAASATVWASAAEHRHTCSTFSSADKLAPGAHPLWLSLSLLLLVSLLLLLLPAISPSRSDAELESDSSSAGASG
jgi:hypothetical protein